MKLLVTSNDNKLFHKHFHRSDSAKEMEASLEEANNMIANLDAQIDTMEKLKNGEVPEPLKIEPQTIIVKEPEIKIIEVSYNSS